MVIHIVIIPTSHSCLPVSAAIHADSFLKTHPQLLRCPVRRSKSGDNWRLQTIKKLITSSCPVCSKHWPWKFNQVPSTTFSCYFVYRQIETDVTTKTPPLVRDNEW